MSVLGFASLKIIHHLSYDNLLNQETDLPTKSVPVKTATHKEKKKNPSPPKKTSDSHLVSESTIFKDRHRKPPLTSFLFKLMSYCTNMYCPCS